MNNLKGIFTDIKIIKRILWTLFFVLLFRWGVMITIPGTTVTGSQIDSGSFIGIMNMLGGGGLTKFSIFALGVTPYVTSSIIIQLLSTDVIPYLTRLNKQGEKGRIKIEKITRITSLVIGFMQALAIILALQNAGILNLGSYNGFIGMSFLTLILVAGSIISLWIADQITISGIGNGTSMIIVAGIVARIPTTLSGQFNWFIQGNSGTLLMQGIVELIFYFLFTLGIIWFIAFFETSERRLPIQQTGQGLNLISGKQTYMPIKVNPAGVVPVIFASSVITLPGTIAQFFPPSIGREWVITNFALTSVFGAVVYALLMILFTFFYAHININAQDTADNFQKSSTFIIGVKPGRDTEKYISKTVTYLSVIGSLEITLLALLPYILTWFGIPKQFAVGGTSMIILVSVATDTWEQLQARMISNSTNVKHKAKLALNDKDKNSETLLFN